MSVQPKIKKLNKWLEIYDSPLKISVTPDTIPWIESLWEKISRRMN